MAEISDGAIYVVAGSLIVPKLVDLVMAMFKGSLARNIEAADKAQAKAQKDVEELGKKVEYLDRKLERLADNHTTQKDATNQFQGEVRGRLEALDARIAGQGKAYEEKISEGFKKVEIELNRKLAQMMADLERERDRRR